ncbi:MAG: glycosyltransferase N-terminal domain-containing protein [Bacteroidota bacterium]
MVFLYNLSIRVYWVLVILTSAFNTKAKQFYRGRKGIWERIKSQVEPGAHIIWVHCSSLGEFEQGRPVIEAIKQNKPNAKILLTFFSPSGYEVRKNYSGAHYIFYLPLDTYSNARRFIKMVNPAMAIFIKYEFWYHYLNELKKKNIPTYLVSAIFRPDQVFFKPYGGWYRKFLKSFTYFFVQNQQSRELLEKIGFTNVVVTGDTRFDRVARIAADAKSIPIVESFAGNHKVLVAGSTWPKDEEVLLPMIKKFPELKIVVVPHEVTESHVNDILSKAPVRAVRFTKTNTDDVKQAGILVVDTVGLLSSIYRYGYVAYVGGGFGVGIHNTLEAAAYGIPVIFGPNYQKFQEAKDLLACKAGFSIKTSDELSDLLNLLLFDKKMYLTSASEAKQLVNSNVGATQKIIGIITTS